ncbi:hypothetical protein F5878DRAFT_109415 [Lentinula raphanica]|uniref:WDR59/RTC1-like RING zinc finger domain-containing protein n=1 Tax=Lentinula raphanica TaxID=153919 RepID=A0AA38PBI5_9AGAR|nr:hypothetical protein F5878DRAFT_109415 [Lentinula raphanica]
MSISPWSRDVVLAARRGLFIIDLEAPFEVPRFLPQGGTWDVADVQWNPHPSRAEYIVSTSSEKLLIWNLNMSGKTSIQHILHAHYRAITDINWHTSERDTVVSTGIDSWVWAWDMREPRRPIFGLSAFRSPGTQVKWNRQNPHILASSHADEVLIWDRRKGSLPVTPIPAHTSRIYGIDWSQSDPTEIVTCSLDKTIRVWDSRTALNKTTIRTSYPVWRARSLPFGRGILSLAQRGETALEMFSLQNQGSALSVPDLPVDSFHGHTDVVKEFVWRRGSNDVFQLITWSKDRTLRFWPVDFDMMQKVGYSRASSGNDVQQPQPSASSSTPTESVPRTKSFRDPTLFAQSFNPVASTGPNPISAPIGHRSILAEVRAGPLVPVPLSQPRTRQRTYSNIAPHATSSPDMFGSVTPTQTQNTLMVPVTATLLDVQGAGSANINSLGLPESLSTPVLSGGGTMSRGAAGGLKSRARVDALSWLSSVKDESTIASAISVAGGEDGNGYETESVNRQRSASKDGTESRNSRSGDDLQLIGPSLQDEITTVLSKLPPSKVRLEKHDLSLNNNKKQHRTLTLGLQVPWARSESSSRHQPSALNGSGATYAYSTQSVFLRVTFTFPRDYPYSPPIKPGTHTGLQMGNSLTTTTPTVNMEYTPLITMKDRAFMLRRLRRIIAILRERQKPCLEACLRFLVFKDESAVELADSGAASHVQRLGSKSKTSANGAVDDSDSEEDIEHLAYLGSHMERDDEVTMLMMRNHKNLAEPRTCQGSFGPNGELVCFFRAPPRIVRNANSLMSHSRSPARNHSNFDRESLNFVHSNETPDLSQSDQETFQRSPALVSDAVRRLTLAARDRDGSVQASLGNSSTMTSALDTAFMTPKPKSAGQGDIYSSSNDKETIEASPRMYLPFQYPIQLYPSAPQVQAQITRIMTNLLTFPRHRGRRQSNSFQSALGLDASGDGAQMMDNGEEEIMRSGQRSYSTLALVAGSTRKSQVVIANTTGLVGGDKSVAEDYVFSAGSSSGGANVGFLNPQEQCRDLVQMCDSNAIAARLHGRYDHERVFRSIGALLATIALSVGRGSNSVDVSTSCLGLVKQLLDRLLGDLRAHKDIQMLAMVSFVALQLFYIPKFYHTMVALSPHSASISTKSGSVLDYFSNLHNRDLSSNRLTYSSYSPNRTTRTSASSTPGSARIPSSPPAIPGTSAISSRGSWSNLFTNGRNFMINAPQSTYHNTAATNNNHSLPPQSPTRTLPSHIDVPLKISRPANNGRSLRGKLLDSSSPSTSLQILHQASISPLVTPPSAVPKSWSENLPKSKEATPSFSSAKDDQKRTFSQVASGLDANGKKRIVFQVTPHEPASPPSYSEEELSLLLQHVYFYAEMLSRWEIYHKRAELLKSITIPKDESELQEHNFDLVQTCTQCTNSLPVWKGTSCEWCGQSRATPKCTVCRLTVKGLSIDCLRCFHVTHVSCWNQLNVPICPSGCGCTCGPAGTGVTAKPSLLTMKNI